MTSKPPIDFTRVEALRKHMLLTRSDMSQLLGVSRMTYYAWVGGKPIRKSNELAVKKMLRRLLNVMTEYNWPMPEVIASTQTERKQRLEEILNQGN